MYSTLMSPIFAGSSGTVFFCGMPTKAVGPVEEAMTPTFIWAKRSAGDGGEQQGRNQRSHGGLQ